MARTTKFQIQHVVQYGLLILERDKTTSKVCSVRCQFCTFCGKEDAIGEKCKKAQTDIVKDWKAPFRPSLY